ncbi:hypothetical protein B0H13DRAFT_2333420 [Mycena leptocephala]|nr:hypothetical protein B0H13DRAFT_2333420 [Mycena leptocephala]
MGIAQLCATGKSCAVTGDGVPLHPDNHVATTRCRKSTLGTTRSSRLAALTPSSCALSVLSCTHAELPFRTGDTARDAYDVDCDAAALPTPPPWSAKTICTQLSRNYVAFSHRQGATWWAPIAAGVRCVRLPAAPPTARLPLHPFPRHWDACSGSRPSCPSVPRIRPLHIFSFLPSTSGDAIRCLQRLVGVVRSCPALLQLRISLPPLDEVGRDGRVSCAAAACVSPRAPLHPRHAPPLSLTVRGVLRPKRITGRRAARRFDVVVHDAQHAADVCRVLGTLTTTRAAGEQGRKRRGWRGMGRTHGSRHGSANVLAFPFAICASSVSRVLPHPPSLVSWPFGRYASRAPPTFLEDCGPLLTLHLRIRATLPLPGAHSRVSRRRVGPRLVSMPPNGHWRLRTEPRI